MPQPAHKPIVPQGWDAVWDEQYQEWYYVHLASGKSQWEAPEGTSFPAAPPPGGPPPRQQQQQQQVHQTTERVIVEKQPIIIQQEAPQPQTQYVQQQQPTRSGPGMGTGLLLGAVVGSAMGRRRGPVIVAPRRRRF